MVSESLATFETTTNEAFLFLGAIAPGQHWSMFDVTLGQARNGQAKLLVITIWNFNWEFVAGRREVTAPGISRDIVDGSLWYRIPRPPEDDTVNARANWRRLAVAHDQGIPVLGVLKDFRTSRCSLDHLFDCNLQLHDSEESATWLHLRPRAGVGCEVDSIDIRQATGGGHADVDDAELIESLIRPNASSAGQGHRGVVEHRQAIEQHAMAMAVRHYSAAWPEVIDVSTRESFDLLCRNGRRELRVEVKGTTSQGRAVLLTPNEVRHAQMNGRNLALFVVAEIVLDSSGVCTGGVVRCIEPWDIGKDEIIATAFECRLRQPD